VLVEPGPRPNPFAFPPDTTFRFALLVAGVVGGIPPVWQQIWLEFNSDRVGAVIASCQEMHPATGLDVDPARAAVDYRYWWEAYGAYLDTQRRAFDCLSPVYGLPVGMATVAGLVAAFSIALTLYWVFPWWVIRRHRAQPLPLERLPSLGKEITRQQVHAGVGTVSWFIDPHSRRVSGLAFGRTGRECILVTGGLVACARADVSAFRSVIRHELAHVANKDIGKTYATLATWYAFILVAIVPWLVLQAIYLLRGEAWAYWAQAWRFAALTLFVVLVRNAILRSRESEADIRAAWWDGDDGSFERGLAAATDETRRTSSWLSPFWRHPSLEFRRKALADPRMVLRMGFWSALAVGLVASIGYDALRDLASRFEVGPTGTMAGVVYGPLVAGFVGLAVWRAAYADHVAGSVRTLRPNRIGVGLGVGLAIGPFFYIQNAYGGEYVTVLGERASALTIISADAIVVFGIWALVRWLAVSSRAWMPSVVRGQSARAGMLRAFAAFAVVSGAVVSIVLFLRKETILHSGPGVPYTVFNAAARALSPMEGESLWITAMALLLTVVLWAHPLGGARRASRGPIAPWATISQRAAAHSDVPSESAFLGPAFRIGFVAAAVPFLAVSCYRAYALSGGVDGALPTAAWLSNLFIVAWVVQILAGITAAVRFRSHPILHALGAACVAGVVATVCFAVSAWMEAPDIRGSWRWQDVLGLAGILMRPGALLTFGVAGLVSLLMRTVRRSRRSPVLPAPSGGRQMAG
jgi:Zn-dependent protease with chaperone function